VSPPGGNTAVSKLIVSVRTWFFVNVVAFCALVAFTISLPKWWPDAFAVGTNLLTGGLVSFPFYFLVVHLPEYRKKSIIKANLLKMYRGIKEDILLEVVLAQHQGRLSRPSN
jgi:hypothetical protein